MTPIPQADYIVPRTIVAAVRMGLSHLAHCKAKGQFLCGLVRGFGSNLAANIRENLAKEVCTFVLPF